MALHLHSVTFDCRAPASLARFWASITGYEIGEANEFFAELNGDGTFGPRFMFIKVPEGKTVKNRVHLDLGTADLEGEIERVSSLGGVLLERSRRVGREWRYAPPDTHSAHERL